MRIGLLGGSFNPPHLGHLAVAVHALEELELDSVALVPAHVAPQKPAAADPGAAHRLAMCRLLVAGSNGLDVSPRELERPGPSFTVDTLAAIHASQPDDELTFILGADTARTLAAWHSPRELLALCSLAVATRRGTDREAVEAVVRELAPDAAQALRFLLMAPIDVSSSEVRERVKRGLPVDELTGAPVAAYIGEHRLYAG